MEKLAALDFALIFPAVLFMVALAIRNLPAHETANGAQRLVMWYTGRIWTLWVLLLALPSLALITGCVALFRDWMGTPHAPRQQLVIVGAQPAHLVVARTDGERRWNSRNRSLAHARELKSSSSRSNGAGDLRHRPD